MERTAAARTRDAPRRRAAVTMEQIEAFLAKAKAETV